MSSGTQPAVVGGKDPLPAGRSERALRDGFDLVKALTRFAASHGTEVGGIPAADVERFAPGLAVPGGATGSEIQLSGTLRLVRFEIERASGYLDAATTVLGYLSLRQRLAMAWKVGEARSVLQALRRHPDPAATGMPKSWRISQALAAFRALRRAHHLRRAGLRRE